LSIYDIYGMSEHAERDGAWQNTASDSGPPPAENSLAISLSYSHVIEKDNGVLVVILLG